MPLDFAWLGQGPAVDLANTYVPGQGVDMLAGWRGLAESEMPDEEWRRLRRAVSRVLSALADGQSPATDAIADLNAASAAAPLYTTLDGDQLRTHEDLHGAVARDALALVAAGASLRRCPAPGCGMLFLPTARRKHWCSPGCGNRGRVARHYRSRQSTNRPQMPSDTGDEVVVGV